MAKLALLISIVLLLAVTCARSQDPPIDIDLSLSQFSSDLLEVLSTNLTNGFAASPLSMFVAASLLSLGASGNTTDEIWNALDITVADRTELEEAMFSLIRSVSDSPDVVLNSILFTNDSEVSSNFTALANADFDFDIQSVDYNDLKVTYPIIMSWVMDKIQNASITTSFSGTYFPNDLYVASVLSFNAEWDSQFDEADTTIEEFFLADGSSVEVEMMNLKDMLYYNKVDNMEIVEIDYYNSNCTCMLMLPSDPSVNVRDHLANWQTGHIHKIASNLRDIPKSFVELSLPKFNASMNTELSSILPLMGVNTMFDDDADFSGMLNDQNHAASSQYFSEVRMNEWGTGHLANENRVPLMHKTFTSGNDSIEFNVNHSFMYYIYDWTNGHVLFYGILMNPAEAATVMESVNVF